MPPLPTWLDTSNADPLAGRVADKAALDQAWDQALEHRRQVVLVGGPPGVGKSRLVAEAGTAAHQFGAIVLHGICYSDYSRPFHPFVEMLKQLVGWTATSEALDSLADECRSLLEVLSPPTEASPASLTQSRRFRLFERFSAVFEHLAELAPVAAVIDDIHWASPPTLDLLNHLVRTLGPQRIMLVATFRVTAPERTEALSRFVVDVYSQPDVVRLDLEGLATAEIEQYLGDRTGRPRSEVGPTATVLRDWTAGNPYYLSEVWESAIDRDHGVGYAVFPASIGEAVQHRVRSLSDLAGDAVRVAALSSDGATPGLVADVLDVDVAVVQEALDHAIAAGLMTERGVARFFFVHDLARQALSQDMPPSRRTDLHGRIADHLERESGGDPSQAATIGYHHGQTGQRPTKAIEFASVAGAFAEQALAFEEAAEHFLGAVAFAKDKGLEEGLLLRAAVNLQRAGRYERGLRHFAAVTKSADPMRRARASIGYADTTWRPGRLGHESVAKLGSALNNLPHDAEPRLAIELQAYMSRALGYAGSHEMALEVGRGALDQARDVGDPALLARCLLYPAYVTPDVSRKHFEEILEASVLIRGIDDLDLHGQATFVRGTTAYALGEPTIWRAAINDLVSIADISGQPFHHIALLHATTSLSFCLGDYQEALGAADKQLEFEDRFGVDGISGLHGAATFMVQREMGLEDVRPLLTGDPTSEIGDWPLGLLAMYTELGMAHPARIVLKQLMATPMVAELAGRYEGAQAVYLTEAAVQLRDRVAADSIYEVLRQRSGTNLLSGHFINVFGSADRYLGMLAAVLGRDARDHFEAAIEMDACMGSTHHRAESRARYAEYLRSSHPDQAEVLAQAALETARLMGSSRIQRIAQPSSPKVDSMLTPRELEVLELVARGHSNRDVARELFISGNTAANHVRNILIKTGCENRTQAARFASDRGLFG